MMEKLDIRGQQWSFVYGSKHIKVFDMSGKLVMVFSKSTRKKERRLIFNGNERRLRTAV
jgi:hypothetical protein